MQPDQQIQEQSQEQPKRSKIGKTEWWILIAIAALVDVAQIALDFLAIGVIVNRYIDIFVAMAAPFYLAIRGVPMDVRTLMLFGASFVAEEIPLADIAPAWTFDIWKIKQWNS
jgi:hypothetical protein